MSTIEVNGRRYRTSGRMDAKKQLHVIRRLAPLMAVVGAQLAALMSGRAEDREKATGTLIALIPIIAGVFAQMEDDDVNYIIDNCLEKVEREDFGSWQKVQAKPGVLQYQDIEYEEMVRLVILVLQENLGNFWRVLSAGQPSSANSDSPDQAPPPSSL